MTESITSAQNPLIKSVAALKQKKYRDQQGLFIVEGVRLCEELAASAWTASLCFYTAEAAASARARAVLAAFAAKDCRLIQVTREVYAKLSDTEQPQGILAVAAKRRVALTGLLAGRSPLLAVLDGVQDPGNVGTVIRNADAAGCTGVVLLGGCADLFAGKTVRATMGSLFHLPVAEGVARAELAAVLADAGVKLAVTALESAALYHDADLAGAVAVVFGNEGQGVSAELLAQAAERVYIPIYGQAESLNVAASSAVVLYEAARQRRANL